MTPMAVCSHQGVQTIRQSTQKQRHNPGVPTHWYQPQLSPNGFISGKPYYESIIYQTSRRNPKRILFEKKDLFSDWSKYPVTGVSIWYPSVFGVSIWYPSVSGVSIWYPSVSGVSIWYQSVSGVSIWYPSVSGIRPYLVEVSGCIRILSLNMFCPAALSS